MGGKPSKNTPADQRLKRNNPNAGKPKAQPVQPGVPAVPQQPQKQPPAKKGGK